MRVLRERAAVVSLRDKKKTENEALDARILMLIKQMGEAHMRSVWAKVGGKVSEREVDRSLQRLRRKGLIAYNGPGLGRCWRAT